MEEQLATGLGEGEVAELVEELSLLTRSTTLKKRPRLPLRMQARAMPTARWDLPVPVPPISTTLRCCARKSPPASSRTSVSLTGLAVGLEPVAPRRPTVEVDLVDLLGQRQPGDGHLVFGRTCLRRRPRTDGGAPPQSR